MNDTTLTGIHHLELTVSDLGRSVGWYREVLGFEVARRMDKGSIEVVMLRSGALIIALVRHVGAEAPGAPDAPAATADRFDERRLGLDHVGFAVPSPDAVDAWAARLDEHGVARSEVKDGALPGSRLVVFRDPDGIQLECYYAPT